MTDLTDQLQQPWRRLWHWYADGDPELRRVFQRWLDTQHQEVYRVLETESSVSGDNAIRSSIERPRN